MSTFPLFFDGRKNSGAKAEEGDGQKLKAFKPLLPFNFQSIYLLEIECKLRLKSLAGKARSAGQDLAEWNLDVPRLIGELDSSFI